jgi:hypothetical protein
MRATKYFVLSCFAAMVGAAPADAAVSVTFTHPERYTDANLYGDYGVKAEEPALRGLMLYLEHLGDRYLKPNQLLTIDVLDVKLAGEYEKWRSRGDDVRVFRRTTWPRIKIRYTLQNDGVTVASAEEAVTDLNYLMHPAAHYYSDDPLRYEKIMLDQWFWTRFVEHAPASG